MRRLLFLVCVFMLQACGCDVPAYALDRFEVDAQGWTLNGGVTNNNHMPELQRTGGDPDGNICGSDDPDEREDVWYFEAPAKYHGNAEAAYGKRLTYELKQSNRFNLLHGREMLLFTTNGVKLSWDAKEAPGTDWTAQSASLDTTGGWKNDTTGEPATEAEIRTVLKSVSTLRIRGDFTDGPDTACLDNVLFGAD